MCVLVATGTLLGCEVHQFGMVRVRQGGWYSGLGVYAVLGAIKDSWEQKVPYLLLAFIPKLMHKAGAAVANKYMPDAVAGVAAAGALLAVVLVVYIVNAAVRHTFVAAV